MFFPVTRGVAILPAWRVRRRPLRIFPVDALNRVVLLSACAAWNGKCVSPVPGQKRGHTPCSLTLASLI